MSFSNLVKTYEEEFHNNGSDLLLPIQRLHLMQKGGSPDYRPGYRGSAVGKLCCREEVFKKILPRPSVEISPDLQVIFEIGHAIHARWQNNILGPAGILEGWWHCRTCDWKVEGHMPNDICPQCKSIRRCGSCKAKMRDQVYVENHACKKCKSESWEYEEYTLRDKEHGIVGHCDGVVLLDGVKYIWEFKTINDNGFKNRISMNPLKEHVAQVQIYMWLKNLKNAIIHYLSKNTGEQKEFHVVYNDSYRKELLRKIALIEERLIDGSLPDHKVCSSRGTWRAKSCPWVKECFNAKAFNKAIEKKKVITGEAHE